MVADKTCLAVHSELFASLAFYFPSQSKLWQMKLLIRCGLRQLHGNPQSHMGISEGPTFAIFDTLERRKRLQRSQGRIESCLILQLCSAFGDQWLNLRMLYGV